MGRASMLLSEPPVNPHIEAALKAYRGRASAHAPPVGTFPFTRYQFSRSWNAKVWVREHESMPCHRALCEPLFRRGEPRLQHMWGYHHCTQTWRTGRAVDKKWLAALQNST